MSGLEVYFPPPNVAFFTDVVLFDKKLCNRKIANFDRDGSRILKPIQDPSFDFLTHCLPAMLSRSFSHLYYLVITIYWLLYK